MAGASINRVAVVGTTSWGCTLALLLSAKGLETYLWARTEREARDLSHTRENRRLLPSVTLPQSLHISHDPEEALSNAQLVIMAVPSQTMRQNARRLAPFLKHYPIIVSAAKGLELTTGLRMSEVLLEELSPPSPGLICALSGPNLSREVAQGQPTSSVVASPDLKVAAQVQEALMTPTFRVYTNTDVIGVELGGALKNIIALGAGLADGLGYGANGKAAFITRGLAEITRLGVAAGAHPLTFAGLAGLGDLIATCYSPLSRNRQVGEHLGRGRTLEAVLREMPHVAEGVSATLAALQLASRLKVEMPIAEKTRQVLFEGLDPRQAVTELMLREPKFELLGIDDH